MTRVSRAIGAPGATAFLGLLAAAAAWGQVPLVVRLPLGLAAVLFLPGFALAGLCFPLSHDLRLAERLGLSLAFSLALIVVVALLLNATAGGLQFQSAVLSITGLTLLLSLAGGVQHWALARRSSGILAPAARGTWLPPAIAIASVGLVAVLAAVAVNRTAAGVEPAMDFYYLGSTGLADAFPRTVTAGSDIPLTIGIDNPAQPGSYQVVAASHGETLASTSVQLRSGASWQGQLAFKLDAGDNQPVDIELLAPASPTPLRSLVLWLNVAAPAQ